MAAAAAAMVMALAAALRPAATRTLSTATASRWRNRRGSPRVARARLWRVLPEVPDLLAGGLAGGLSVVATLEVVADLVPDPLGVEFRQVVDRLRRGEVLGPVLAERRAHVDPALRPLFELLSEAHADGAPVVDPLRVLGADLRDQRRRRAEARARRVAVLMLFPLVFCILPAFVLIALVPLMVGALSGLGG